MTENQRKSGGLVQESGRSWRLLAHGDSASLSIEDEGSLDELVLDGWFHLERMQENLWWLRVGDARLLVELHENGSVDLRIDRGFYEDVVALST